jgi:alkanesulfonate monooxygenase SsuD/methylene tetrahydromethanopterin reductase-like flavin-dependent oxidoreductase (luciferase family)
MPFMWSAARVERSKGWAARGLANAPGRAPLDIAHGIPTFIGDDIEALRDAARVNLAIFTTFPFYQRMFRASGFAEEAAMAEASAGGASLSDRMLDAICLIGPVLRCREQLAAFRAAGVDLPILSPPIGVDGARAVIRAFRG